MNSTGHNYKVKTKRNRKRILEKVEILHRMESGMSNADVALEYNLAPSTVSDIKRNKKEILMQASVPWRREMKSYKAVTNSKMEEKLVLWIQDRIRLGLPVTGPLICAQAKIINREIEGNPTFKGSNGWLEKFRKRHGIKHIISSEKTVILETADHFINPILGNQIKQEKDPISVDEEKSCLEDFEKVSAQEALDCLNKVFRWMERQPECTHFDLSLMDRIRHLAKQKSIKTANK